MHTTSEAVDGATAPADIPAQNAEASNPIADVPAVDETALPEASACLVDGWLLMYTHGTVVDYRSMF
jgi:hypothetical protein